MKKRTFHYLNLRAGANLDVSQIYMCKQFLKRQIVTDVAGLIIFRNRQVLYTVSTEVRCHDVVNTEVFLMGYIFQVIIACPMRFSAYPLDQQLCKFLVTIK